MTLQYITINIRKNPKLHAQTFSERERDLSIIIIGLKNIRKSQENSKRLTKLY